ncbi:unnamed protein product [Polarella glacialis]|uniref:cGMP-dependent protein kinase n=2 Tax=Polarella glacialis TaxID=89957 RepID=A0A813HVQ6_POLGL|nr:unnamed protein product [Polarella glacialis]
MKRASAEIKQQFKSFDNEGAGNIARADLAMIIIKLGMGRFAPDDIDKMFKQVERISGGKNGIKYDDFVDWAFSSGKVIEHRMARLRGVKLFDSMGEKEIEVGARVLELQRFAAGHEIIVQGSEGFDCFIVDSGELFASVKIGDEWKEVKQYSAGGFFGERALLRDDLRAASVIARTEVMLFRMSREHFVEMIRERENRETLISGCKMFETMTDEQVAKLGGVVQHMMYPAGTKIINQGEEGHHFYLLENGECAATIKMADGTDQEVKRYYRGELFGEKALLESAPRGASISAVGEVTAFMCSQSDFVSKLGPLSQLKAEQYLADPRKLICDFYQTGDEKGPRGSCLARGVEPDPQTKTDWFAVYRPCSRDSIAKMLGKIGVGKGLNVKGKSAKKNRLSGFVPFIQISENCHKTKIEASPADARTKIFYRSAGNRDIALAAMSKLLYETEGVKEMKMREKDREIKVIDEYKPDAFGLDVPELIMREAYIIRPDISPMVGWETGRESEPAFMDMNLHSVRGGSVPSVVVYQHDMVDPMNPLGLLVAYAEATVKPVVSDFDTFTVGSRGMNYEPVPEKQAKLALWSLDHASDVIGAPGSKAWTSRWLDVLKEEAQKGFHPDIPKFGFGDPTSVGMIDDVVNVSSGCGAVRHGAECFNYYFPQELDEDFLVVWEGFSDPPWRTFDEPELRAFLLERATEGYAFPTNPIWAVRDPGWYEVLQALRDSEEAKQPMSSWYTQEALDKIDEIHEELPDGFKVKNNTSGKLRGSIMASAQDLTGEELVDFAKNEVRKVAKARWAKTRQALITLGRMVKNGLASNPIPEDPAELMPRSVAGQ